MRTAIGEVFAFAKRDRVKSNTKDEAALFTSAAALKSRQLQVLSPKPSGTYYGRLVR